MNIIFRDLHQVHYKINNYTRLVHYPETKDFVLANDDRLIEFGLNNYDEAEQVALKILEIVKEVKDDQI